MPPRFLLRLAPVLAALGSGCATLIVKDEIDCTVDFWRRSIAAIESCRVEPDPRGEGLVLAVRARSSLGSRLHRATVPAAAGPAGATEVPPVLVTYAAHLLLDARVADVGPDGRPGAADTVLTRDRARTAAIVQVLGVATPRVRVRLFLPPAGERSDEDIEGDLLARRPPDLTIEIDGPVRPASFVAGPLLLAGAALVDAATLPIQAAVVIALLAVRLH